ncbi:MAG: glycosyltransferase family 4 protein [Vicinamibacterales bacterium]
MARILVVTSHPPLAAGGHLVIGHELVAALRRAGHESELWLTPQNRFGRQGAAYVATWLTDLGLTHDGRAVDQVVSLRFPSYAIRHPRHVCWLNHTMREYYDLWPRFSAGLSTANAVKEGLRRRAIHAADRYFLSRVSKLFVLSATVGARLSATLGLDGTVLLPPAPRREYRCDAYEPFLLAVSRLTSHKRLNLLLDALATPDARGVRLVIAGDGEERAALERQARALAVDDRVTFRGRVDDVELLDLLARCRAVCFTPVAEDFGFVTVEAFACGKSVITCRDSGGPAELVRHDGEGLVVEPAATDVGRAMGRLQGDETAARTMGQRALVRSAQLSWEETVRQLVIV